MYRENVRLGYQDDFMPDWISDFAVAAKLGVPVAELDDQPARLIYRARTLLEAEHLANDARERESQQA